MASVKGMFLRGPIWWLRYTVNGKQRRVSLETELESLAAMNALVVLQRAPLEVGAEGSEFLVELERYFAESLAKGRLSSTFIPSRRYVLSQFAREMGVDRLSDLSVAVVERWVVWLKGGRGVRDGTVESYLFHLRAFGSWLVKHHKMHADPAQKVDLGKVTRPVRKNFVEKADVARLIEKAPNDDLRFVLFCGFHAGMRKLEIVEARPGWIKLGAGGRRGRISIEKTPTFSPKDRDERTIPLTAEFEEFLKKYLPTVEGKDYLLRPETRKRSTGKKTTRYRYDFRVPFEKHLAACEVESSAHDMRRTFVSLRLIEDSSLIFKLAKWTGDGVEVLQRHYGHLLADDDDIELGGTSSGETGESGESGGKKKTKK